MSNQNNRKFTRRSFAPETGNGAGQQANTVRDDHVLGFKTDRGGAMGRVVKLGPSVHDILTRHDYPEPVARALGEALALTAMLGTTLKIEGRLILQTSTDGPLRMLVANFEAPGQLRGYASFDDTLNTQSLEDLDGRSIFGHGHLALTIDPGGERDRYQGIVPMEGNSLSDAAMTYFHQSEQLPTHLSLAVARQMVSGDVVSDSGTDVVREDAWRWRAGGLLVQHIAREGGRASTREEKPTANLSDSDTDVGAFDDADEDWQRTRLLAATVEDHELIDPMLTSEALLYRLFNEEGVRVFDAIDVETFCRCSRERVAAIVKNFDVQELANMREPDGGVTVTCEFCNSSYRFEPDDV